MSLNLSKYNDKDNKGRYEIYMRWNNFIKSNWTKVGSYALENERDRDYRYLKIKYKDSPREYRKVNK